MILGKAFNVSKPETKQQQKNVIFALPISYVLVKFRQLKVQMIINCKAIYRIIIINIILYMYFVFYTVSIELL